MTQLEKKLTESGAKAYQRGEDSEWRIKPYSDWHRTLDKSLVMLDIDFIEWRFRNGRLIPVGVMEITRVDSDKEVHQGYLNAIISRFEERDIQARSVRYVANALRAKAYIVLFREDCGEFWVYNLSDKEGWFHFTPHEYKEFLKGL